MNTQPIEKIRPDLTTVEVHSIFYTIQGEGPFAGRPAVFVRLAGCNLQCPWCDTEYTSKREAMTFPAVRIAVMAALAGTYSPAERETLIVITGGEPFRQAALGNLVAHLAMHGYAVQIETNGTIQPEVYFPWNYCTVVCSPKTPRINPVVWTHANCFKYVLDAGSVDDDGLPTTVLGGDFKSIAKPRDGASVYLQPADESSCTKPDSVPSDALVHNHANRAAVVRSCLKYGYTLCLQMHKIANLP